MINTSDPVAEIELYGYPAAAEVGAEDGRVFLDDYLMTPAAARRTAGELLQAAERAEEPQA